MRKRQTMEIIETFGHYVENLTDKKPQSARRLLKTGWEAQNLKKDFPAIFLQAKQRGRFCSRQRIRELQRHCAVITRHFLVQRRKDFCQSLNVLFIPT